jgi:hypothetical protein
MSGDPINVLADAIVIGGVCAVLLIAGAVAFAGALYLWSWIF